MSGLSQEHTHALTCKNTLADTHTHTNRGRLSGIFYLLHKWVPSTKPPIRSPLIFYRMINLTGFTCGTGLRPVCVCVVTGICAHMCIRLRVCNRVGADMNAGGCVGITVPCCRDCMAAVGCMGTRPCLWRLRICCCWSCCIWISCCWKASCLLPNCC